MCHETHDRLFLLHSGLPGFFQARPLWSMKGGREKEMGEEVEGRCRQADFSNSTVYRYKIPVQQCGTGTRTGTTFRTGTHLYWVVSTDLLAALLVYLLHGRQVTFGQVHHVNIVPHPWNKQPLTYPACFVCLVWGFFCVCFLLWGGGGGLGEGGGGGGGSRQNWSQTLPFAQLSSSQMRNVVIPFRTQPKPTATAYNNNTYHANDMHH